MSTRHTRHHDEKIEDNAFDMANSNAKEKDALDYGASNFDKTGVDTTQRYSPSTETTLFGRSYDVDEALPYRQVTSDAHFQSPFDDDKTGYHIESIADKYSSYTDDSDLFNMATGDIDAVIREGRPVMENVIPRFAPPLFTTTGRKFDEHLPTQPPQLHRDLQRKLRIQQGLDPDPPIPHEDDVPTKLRHWLEDVKDRVVDTTTAVTDKITTQGYELTKPFHQDTTVSSSSLPSATIISTTTKAPPVVVKPTLTPLIPPRIDPVATTRFREATSSVQPIAMKPLPASARMEAPDMRKTYYTQHKTPAMIEAEHQEHLRKLEQREKKVSSHVERYTSPGSVVPVNVPLYVRPPALSHDYLLQLPPPTNLDATWITEPCPMVYIPHTLYTNRNIVSRLPFRFWPRSLNRREQILLRLDETMGGSGPGAPRGGSSGGASRTGGYSRQGAYTASYLPTTYVDDFIQRHIDLLSDPLFYQWTFLAQQAFSPHKDATRSVEQKEPIYTTVTEDLVDHYRRGEPFKPIFFYGRDDYGNKIDHPEHGDYRGYPIYGYQLKEDQKDPDGPERLLKGVELVEPEADKTIDESVKLHQDVPIEVVSRPIAEEKATRTPDLSPRKHQLIEHLPEEAKHLRPIRERLLGIKLNRHPKLEDVDKQEKNLQKLLKQHNNNPALVKQHFSERLTPRGSWFGGKAWNAFTKSDTLPDMSASTGYAERMRDLYLSGVQIDTPFECQQPRRFYSKIAPAASENEIIGRSSPKIPWSYTPGVRDRKDPRYTTLALPTPYKQRAYILHGIDDLLEDRNYYRQRFSLDPFAQEILKYERKNNVFLHKGEKIPIDESNRYLLEDHGLPSPVVDYSYKKNLFDPNMYQTKYYGSFHDDYVRYDGNDTLRLTYPHERRQTGSNVPFSAETPSLSFVDHQGYQHTHRYETRMLAHYRENRVLKRLRQTWRENIRPQLDRWALHLNNVLPAVERDEVMNSSVMNEHLKKIEHRQVLKQWKKDKQELTSKNGDGSESKKSFVPTTLPVTSVQVEYNPNILAPIRQSFIYEPSQKRKPPAEYENFRTSNYYTDDQRKFQEYMIRKRYDINTYRNPDGTKRPLSNDRLDKRYMTDIRQNYADKVERRRQGRFYQWYHRLVEPYLYHPVYHPRKNDPYYQRENEDSFRKPGLLEETEIDDSEYQYQRFTAPSTIKDIQKEITISDPTTPVDYREYLIPERSQWDDSEHVISASPEKLSVDTDLTDSARRAQEHIRYNIIHGYEDAKQYTLRKSNRPSREGSQDPRKKIPSKATTPWDAEFNEWFMPIYDWGGLFG